MKAPKAAKLTVVPIVPAPAVTVTLTLPASWIVALLAPLRAAHDNQIIVVNVTVHSEIPVYGNGSCGVP